jgi:hypothetical protein
MPYDHYQCRDGSILGRSILSASVTAIPAHDRLEGHGSHAKWEEMTRAQEIHIQERIMAGERFTWSKAVQPVSVHMRPDDPVPLEKVTGGCPLKSQAVKNYWARMTPEERIEKIKRRKEKVAKQ